MTGVHNPWNYVINDCGSVKSEVSKPNESAPGGLDFYRAC